MTKKNYLSKTSDYISHYLLIAKLDAYGFEQNALNINHNYLFERSQKTEYIMLCTPRFNMASLLQSTWNIISSLKFTKLKITFLQILWDIFHFQENENCNLRSGAHLAWTNMRTILFGKEMVSNLGAKIWPLLPEEHKNAWSLQFL